MECRERAEPPGAPPTWREPEWPASLPPLGVRESERSAELPSLVATSRTAHQRPTSTQAAVSGLGATRGSNATVLPIIGDVVSHYLETAPVTNAYRHSNLIEAGATEDEMRQIVGAMETLIIEGPTQQAISQNPDTERVQVTSPSASFPPERGNDEVGPTRPGEPQEAMAIRTGQTPEPKTPQPTSLRATDSATISNPSIQPQIAPQMGTQVNSTAIPSTQAPASTASASSVRESWGLSKHGTPLDQHGNFRMWSLRKRR